MKTVSLQQSNQSNHHLPNGIKSMPSTFQTRALSRIYKELQELTPEKRNCQSANKLNSKTKQNKKQTQPQKTQIKGKWPITF